MTTPTVKLRFETENDDAALRRTDEMRAAMVSAARAANDMQQAYARAASGSSGMREASIAAEQTANATKNVTANARSAEAAVRRQEAAVASATNRIMAFGNTIKNSAAASADQQKAIERSAAELNRYSNAVRETSGRADEIRQKTTLFSRALIEQQGALQAAQREERARQAAMKEAERASDAAARAAAKANDEYLRSALANKSAAQSAAVFESAFKRQETAIATAERQVTAYSAAVQRSNLGQQEQARLIQAVQNQYTAYATTIQRTGASQLAASTATNQWRSSIQGLQVELQNLKLQEHAASMQRFHSMAASGGRAFGGYGLVLQQVGFQAADMAVQLQMGTSFIQTLTQQGSQLLGFFGPLGAVLGAVGAVAGATALYFMNSSDALADTAESAVGAEDALREYERTLASVQGRSQDFEASLRDANQELKSQQVLVLEAALQTADQKMAETAAEAERITGLVNGLRANVAASGGAVPTPIKNVLAEYERQQARLNEEYDAQAAVIDDLTARLGILRDTRANDNSETSTTIATLQEQVKFQQALATAYQAGAKAVREARVEQAIFEEQTKANVSATSDEGKEIARLVRQKMDLTEANDNSAKAASDAAAETKRQEQEAARLNERRTETIEELQDELRYQEDLRRAHDEGTDAINAVTDAREAELIVQQLKLRGTEIEAGLIRELVAQINAQERAIQQKIAKDRESEQAAEKSAKAQEKAAEEVEKAYEKTFSNIRDFSEEALGDSFYDMLRGETVDFAEFMETTLLRAIANVAAAAATQTIVMPIATSVVGGMPGLFGLPAAANQNSGGLGSLFGGQGGFNPLSALNFIGDSVTQGIGGIVSSIFPAQSAAAGASIFGAEAGIAAQGAMQAAGGAQLLSSVAGPAALAAMAAFTAYQMGLIGPGPTSGPVGIADFSPGLGRDLQFGPNAVNPLEFLTADNGGNAESMRPIAEAIAEIIANSADRFSATIDESLRFRVASYASPEDGNSKDRVAGFEVNAFIRGEAEKRIAEGLSQTDAIFEAFNFAIKEAFTFENADLQTVARNTVATTVEGLLSDLDFGETFRSMFAPVLDAAGPLETALDQMSDAFDEAKKRAEALGLTTDDLSRNFAAANDNMKEAFRASLGAEAAGVGGQFGQIMALATELDQLSKDAAIAGVSAETLATVIDGRLTAAVAGLTSGEIQSLINALSEVKGQVQGADLAMGGLIDARAAAEERQMYDALIYEQTMRVEALELEKDALDAVSSAASRFGRVLRQTAQGLLTDPEFSPLSALDRVNEARSQFESALALANDGTPFDTLSQDAIDRLPDLSRTLLEASRAYYASSEGYLRDFALVQKALNSTAASLETIEQQQLSQLTSIDTRLAAAVTALENLRIVAAGGTPNTGAAGGSSGSVGSSVAAPDSIGGGTINADQFISRQNAYLTNNPDVAAGIEAGWFASGYDHWLKAGQFEDGRQGFATGGSFTVGGAAGNDNLMMPRVRVTAGEVVNVSRQDNMAAMAEELRALRRDNAELFRQLTQVTATGSVRVIGALQEGNATQKRMASTAERNAAKPAAA
ncbi:hypothetical protein [Thalassobaculum litoreum]|uniref:Prophage tail length tape measure protein n=1 Tax=Thalassobaculum litoreum DSM 18839 TaxID=1123362 RepID=A0A8G2F3B6_9PROT|nr:hypothetical protein [Thalassobaculum litoreum]SDF83745.1 hypothetical protein SAMN05660686_02480 [Thalassobaculum litoreum DSM 18839]